MILSQVTSILLALNSAVAIGLLATVAINKEHRLKTQQKLEEVLQSLLQLKQDKDIHQQLYQNITQLLQAQTQMQAEQRTAIDQHQLNTLKALQESIQKHMQDLRHQLNSTLQQNSQQTDKQLLNLTHRVDQQLNHISGQVEKRLTAGFEKTTTIFNDVIKRLAMIDAAQKQINELSTNVVSLQSILTDKRSRGAFGEVQLIALIRNVMPENTFKLQHTLSNGKRADCLLLLPEPTGHIAIDAKFPLETFQQLADLGSTHPSLKSLQQQLRQDIRKHITDIADKYIIPGETSEGAIMFLPAEAVFAEIHAHYPELVSYAYERKVWLTSPTTMMAILTTATAALKDVATRKQVHIIQEHLRHLNLDFGRFQKRMDNLARHIAQAHTDVEQVHLSSQKISKRFDQIEQVQLEDLSDTPQLAEIPEAVD